MNPFCLTNWAGVAPKRRDWLKATVALGVTVHMGRASASGTPPPSHLHLLNRLAFGPSPQDLARLDQMGAQAWVREQLEPERLPLPGNLQTQLSALPSLSLSQHDLVAQYRDAVRQAVQDPDSGKTERREMVQQRLLEAGEARLWRALQSPRQLEEVMVDFWFNHFNVFVGKGLDRVLVENYEREAIRPHVFGRFADLLGATARHPAMLFYLDNWMSVAPGYVPRRRAGQATALKLNGLNENYARELMELHTLGVDGGYSQKDVTELARMLTGWTFDLRSPGRSLFVFDPARHDMGYKNWLGRSVSASGQGEGDMALDVLAHHPATARHLAFKLAQYFVSDTPPRDLVDRLAQRFVQSDGHIRVVLAELFASPEFSDPAAIGAKFKTPYRYVLSALRAGDSSVRNVRPLLGALNQLGMPLYGCQTPDGYKNTEAAWLNPEAITRRVNLATALASGKLPLGAPPEAAPVRAADLREHPEWASQPLQASALLSNLGPGIGQPTRAEIAESAPALQAALILGSPDFMRH